MGYEFLGITIEKMVKSSNNIYICTEKQKEHIERLSAIYIHSLSSIEEREREEKITNLLDQVFLKK